MVSRCASRPTAQRSRLRSRSVPAGSRRRRPRRAGRRRRRWFARLEYGRASPSGPGGIGKRPPTPNGCGVAQTQDAIYSELDADLSWSERDLPERVRTKHVHRLHPYLGKFIPQLVEALLARHVPRGRVLDPFAGSGTTLVQALESGLDACGADVAAFNCLLMRVKTHEYNPFVLESELRDALARLDAFEGERPAGTVSRFVRDWYAPRAAAELLFFRGVVA